MGAMKGRMRRKGIFFTFIAITITAVFILVFTPQADISLQKDRESVKARISSIDNYVNDLESIYFEAILRATTFKAILSLVNYMNSTGSYISNLDSAFSEVMLTGKINGIPIDEITGKKIMGNNTLADWSSRIAETAKDTLNVDTTIKISNISAFQAKPWNIESALSLELAVKSNVAEWKKNITVATTIGIEGFDDPYYIINTGGTYANKVKKSGVEFNQWNTAKVREHIRNGTYAHWENSGAPSFLMRFTNTMANSSCCGIESLVNPNKINPSDQMESYADYLFWSHKFAGNCSQLYNITGLWDEFRHFKLDFDNVIKYNITFQDAIKSCQ